MDITGLATSLSADANARKRKLSLCYHLGVPKEDIADLVSLNHFDFFSNVLEIWIRRTDNWNLEGLSNALDRIGAETLARALRAQIVIPETDETETGIIEPLTEQPQQSRRPSVLLTHGVGELPSTFAGTHVINDIAESVPVIRRIKFELQHGNTSFHYSSLSDCCVSPTCPPQPFQSWEAKKGEHLEDAILQVEHESLFAENTTGEPDQPFEIELDPEDKTTLVPSENPMKPDIIQHLKMLDEQNSLIPEHGLDIPRIASLLSANAIAYKKRVDICYHLGIPKEDLEFIVSLPPYQFFSKLLWSWELRDDAWAEIRLARALDHIGIHDDSNGNNAETPSAHTVPSNEELEPLTKRQRNHSVSEKSSDEAVQDNVSQHSVESALDQASEEQKEKYAWRSRAKLAASKVFGSRKRLAQIERQKHYLELQRSFDGNRNSNSLQLVKLNKFLSMYLKATLSVIQSIPLNPGTDDAPTTTLIQNTRNDLKTVRRVYKRSKILKKNILKRNRSGLETKGRDWNARNIYLQAEPAFNISSCHM